MASLFDRSYHKLELIVEPTRVSVNNEIRLKKLGPLLQIQGLEQVVVEVAFGERLSKSW